ncbi:protein of unknown function [Candidatus Nitrotoga arctica]|uniref:Uncharacterized protein n=1 Tax=Candidatus Nitrotoga arctica TaxID=453162 RepID=A0ABM8YXG9_9PROT|nr:protein of unknown function [Candidatus Nitrotoga arctica]
MPLPIGAMTKGVAYIHQLMQLQKRLMLANLKPEGLFTDL